MGELLRKNSKMSKSADDKREVYNWSLPAIKTCPAAGKCKEGCYATMGGYQYPNTKNSHGLNYQLTLDKAEFLMAMTDELMKREKSATRRGKQLYVRVHDAGDFYSPGYAKAWMAIAMTFPKVVFYAYTKQVKLFRKLAEEEMIPHNFQIIFSEGGIFDHLIDTKTERHSRVFSSEEELLAAGYTNASKNDLEALGPNKKVGLVYHGFKSKAWSTAS